MLERLQRRQDNNHGVPERQIEEEAETRRVHMQRLQRGFQEEETPLRAEENKETLVQSRRSVPQWRQVGGRLTPLD